MDSRPATGAPEERPSPLGRPLGITALSVFFVLGAAIAGTCAIALLFPGGALEWIWRLRPGTRGAFMRLGIPAIALMAVVSAACAAAAAGLWRGARWGHRLAVGVLAVILVVDTLRASLGCDPRARIDIPIASSM